MGGWGQSRVLYNAVMSKTPIILTISFFPLSSTLLKLKWKILNYKINFFL